MDYGLAYRFMVDGVHVVYREDPKCAHDGTVEYASCDAHKGARERCRTVSLTLALFYYQCFIDTRPLYPACSC